MKKNLRRVLATVSCAALLFALSACSNGGGNSGGNSPSGDGNKQIVYITKNLTNPIWLQTQKGAEAAAAEHGYTVTTLAPTEADNQEEQTNIIIDQLNTDIAGMLLIICDDEGVVPAIEQVNDAGLPLVIAASRPTGGDFVWVGQDNTSAGEVGATSLVEKIGGSGNVIMLDGTPGVQAAEQIHEGAMSVFESNSDITVLESITAKFMRQDGMTVMEDLLQKYPDIDGVFAANDEMALGAYEAIKAAGREGDITVIGCDCNIDAVQSIRDGGLAGTVDKRWYNLGYDGVTNLIEVIEGNEVADSLLECVAVDSSNLDEYLAMYELDAE